MLWACLTAAAHETDIASARAEAVVAKYLIGWPRPGDFGIVAPGRGAAWARLFGEAERSFVWTGRPTPELVIGVLPSYRGRGLGTALLTMLMEDAARRGHGLALNVREGNPARHLYERLGFRLIPGSALHNRAGTRSLGYAWIPDRRLG